MTRDEMNVRSAKMSKGRIFATLGPIALALSACAGAFEANQGGSLLDARVQALVDANRHYPQWSDFPRSSGDAPSAQDIAAKVELLVSAQTGMEGEVRRLVWTVDDPVKFEAQVRERLATVPTSPDSIRTLQQLEAWAEDLRRRGEPPPRIPPRP